MTTRQIYDIFISLGIKFDSRGEEKVRMKLEDLNKKYKLVNLSDHEIFDKESLFNPYSDSRILNTDGKKINKIMAGIDISGQELLLAKQNKADLVIAHHPHGVALTGLTEVMPIQNDIFVSYKVPVKKVNSLMKDRILEINNYIPSLNFNRDVDMAKNLKLDFMCVHTPADNLASDFIINLYKKNKNKLKTVGDLVTLLKTVSEYDVAERMKCGPRNIIGLSKNTLGKVAFVGITGGGSGPKGIYKELSKQGIKTIVSMNMKPDHQKEAKKHKLNVIVAGHMSSDSLGMNLLLDHIEKKGIKVIPISGLVRVKRF